MVLLLICSLLIVHNVRAQSVNPSTPDEWKPVDWLIGKWRSEYDGKIAWPTVPTLTYGEYLELLPAPLSLENGVPMLRLAAYSWSHSTKDNFLDTYGYMVVDKEGNATLLATMNNGFNTMESGPATYGLVNLGLKEIGRMTIARQIPVEDLNRQFRLIDQNYMEQIISMRTAQHPHIGLLEHARVLYKRQRDPPPTTTSTTTTAAATSPVVVTVSPQAADNNVNGAEAAGQLESNLGVVEAS